MSAVAVSDRQALLATRAAAFDASPDAGLIVAPSGVALAANEAAERLFGQGFAALIRTPLVTAFGADAGFERLVDRALAEEGVVRRRDVEVRLLGRPAFVADVVAAPAGDGSVLLTFQVRDPLDGGPERTGFSAPGIGHMLAHEIKNPLAGIRGAAQLLMNGLSPDDATLAQLIVDETDRIRRLVDRMEILADDAPPERAAVNIHQILDRVRAITANASASGLTVQENYDPSLPPAWGEEDQLIQLFLNLTKNAAEAAQSRGDGRGEITLSTAWRHGVRVRGGDGKEGRGAPLEVKVTDNGPGVPTHLRTHLFEPFVTTKPQGAGLGLAISARIAVAHGGHIDFESESGRTSFRVLLPAAPSATP